MYRSLSEKRKFVRVHSSLPLHYRDYEHFVSSLSRDISEDGIRFTSNRFIPVSVKLLMDICLFHDAEPIKVITEVIWVEKLSHMDLYYVGAKFVDLSETHRRLISNYLSSNITAYK